MKSPQPAAFFGLADQPTTPLPSGGPLGVEKHGFARPYSIQGSQAMKRPNLKGVTTEALVERFAALATQQGIELDSDDIAAVNRLYWELEAVEAELKARPGDERRALLRLYDYPNMQVRLKAVKATLAVAPDAARQMLQAIAESHEQPQAGEAGMSIWALDEGIFKPK